MSTLVDEHTIEVVCNEPRGPVSRTARLLELSTEELKHLWRKLSPFKTIFADFQRGTVDDFVNMFITINGDGTVTPNGLIWKVDDVGIVFFDDYRVGGNAYMHVSFWDRRFRGREEITKAIAVHAMEVLNLNRLTSLIPITANAARFYILKLGFKREGRIRELFLFEDRWHDVECFGLLRREAYGKVQDQTGAAQVSGDATSN